MSDSALAHKAFLAVAVLCLSSVSFIPRFRENVLGSGKNVKEIIRWRRLQAESSSVKSSNFTSCDFTTGKWIWNPRGIPKQAPKVEIMTNDYQCQLLGLKNLSYLNYQWKPNNCQLPSFNSTDFLLRMKNRRISFVGDSFAVTQFKSLAGLLIGGSPRESFQQGSQSYFRSKSNFLWAVKFPKHNLSLEVYFSPYLVTIVNNHTQPPSQGNYIVNLNEVDPNILSVLSETDIVVFNTDHWFMDWSIQHHNVTAMVNGVIVHGMNGASMMRIAMQTWSSWIDKKAKVKGGIKGRLFFRSFEPHHTTGKYICPGPLTPSLQNPSSPMDVQYYISRAAVKATKFPVTFLDITFLSNSRIDAHVPDCTHYCVPGLPDTWTEILYAMFLNSGGFGDEGSSKSKGFVL